MNENQIQNIVHDTLTAELVPIVDRLQKALSAPGWPTKRDVPQRLTDFAEWLATPSKPPSAWMDELDRAQRRGEITVLTRKGKKYGTRYTTLRDIETYLQREYRAVNG